MKNVSTTTTPPTTDGPRRPPKHCAAQGRAATILHYTFYILHFSLLSGCLLGPDHTPPAPPALTAELPQTLTAADAITLAELTSWWDAFDDPVLTGLIHAALSSNRTLRAAQAAVRESRERLAIAHASLRPALDANGAVNRFSNSDNSTRGSGTLYHAGFDASWELDLFGRNRRGNEAALATLEADAATLANTWVTLAAETAATYVQLQTARARLDVAQTNLLLQTQTLDLISSRHASGIASGLATEQARYILEQTRSSIPLLLAREEALLNVLAVLTGALPGELSPELAAPRPIPEIPPQHLVGLPAELLRNRPDIRRAERLLAAQTARVAQADAERYPRISLSGSIGLESINLGDLVKPSSRFWDFLPAVHLPVFNAGAIRANIRVQSALEEQALALCEQAILEAVAELRSALAAYAREYARRDALLAAQDAAREAHRLAQDQYLNGLIDFNATLDAQRALLAFGDTLAASDGLITQHLIAVYKALGGGWKTPPPR
ncbi:MAG: efflux transporter outer membrane subunit [Kiritimatiellaeota bacterium]|nr:efflux transporter outer membrane subunit [Kiritimatiellota bacterium]